MMFPPGAHAIFPYDLLRNIPGKIPLQIRRRSIVPGTGIQVIPEISLDIQVMFLPPFAR
jgi:hypothetical protein